MCACVCVYIKLAQTKQALPQCVHHYSPTHLQGPAQALAPSRSEALRYLCSSTELNNSEWIVFLDLLLCDGRPLVGYPSCHPVSTSHKHTNKLSASQSLMFSNTRRSFPLPQPGRARHRRIALLPVSYPPGVAAAVCIVN